MRGVPRLTRNDRYRLLAPIFAGLGAAIKSLPWCGALVFVAWFARDVLVAYAGQTTSANVVVQLFADFRIAVLLPWAVGAGGIIYGIRQKHLKEQAIERLTKRTHELERIVDPARTSSGLTPRGRTRPEDR